MAGFDAYDRRMQKTALLLSGLTLVLLNAVAGAAPAPPKYVILMIADGGGFNHFRAASSFLTGKADGLTCDAFPVKLAVSTFSATGQGYDPARAARDPEYIKMKPTDSAAAATALASGYKTSNGSLGVDVHGRPLSNTTEMAASAGRSVGLITTVPFSHATPAGFAAHDQDRDKYSGIAEEMVLRCPLTVLMGCGNPDYDTNGKARPVPFIFDFVGGIGLWEKIRHGEAVGVKNGRSPAGPWTFVESRASFVALATGAAPARVIGVAAAHKTLQQERAASKDWNGDGKIDAADAAAEPAFGDPFTATVPTLAEMTRASLNVLDDNPRGFFLMVEGGAVDWAAHNNQGGRMIEEMAGFDEAIKAVCDWVDTNGGWSNSLVIVTADHETGYLQGTDGAAESAPCYKPVTISEKGKMPGMTWLLKSHTNQLVPLYAKGCYADRFADKVRGTDPLRGPYVDDTDIGRIILEAVRAP